MYHTFPFFIASILSLFCFLPNANACVDPNTVITTTLNFSEDFTEMEVRLGNLQLHTEQPNIFCSCALSGFDEYFVNPNYIAFVYAGTNNVYPNFDVWDNTAATDASWHDEYPSYPNWSGYISEVLNDGLSVDDEVEMVIRVSTPMGTYFSLNEVDSSMSLLTLGTDMWLPDEGTMAFDHPGIRNLLYDASSYTTNEVELEYFEHLDNGVLSSDIEIDGSAFDLNIFPNPAKENMWVSFNLPVSETVQFYFKDISGKLIGRVYEEDLPEGKQVIPLELNGVLPENGIYLLEIRVGDEIGVRKFIR